MVTTDFPARHRHQTRRGICAALALWLTLLQPMYSSLGLPFAQLAHAQSNSTPDITPPQIELDELTESVADFSQVFSARVIDNRQLTEVTLHFRRDGNGPFERIPMKSLGDTEFYSASLATEPDDLRNFEYYFQAIDGAGNRSVSGFAFEPYVRELVAPESSPTAPAIALTDPVQTPNNDVEVASATTTTTTDSTSNGGSGRWWMIALGVLAVGALASAANSGDNAGDAGATPPADPTNPSIIFTVPSL